MVTMIPWRQVCGPRARRLFFGFLPKPCIQTTRSPNVYSRIRQYPLGIKNLSRGMAAIVQYGICQPTNQRSTVTLMAATA